MPQLLSEYFGVSPAALDELGVFDTFIDLDSQLHVDPHLLGDSEIPEMHEAAEAVIKHFEAIVILLRTSEKPEGPLWDEAKKRLRLKELRGVSLGYSKQNADGSAVGTGLAAALAERAYRIIKAGEQDPRIFELVGLFTEDYGPDRISDVALRIAEVPFAKYTQRAAALGIPTAPAVIRGITFQLPVHEHKGKQRHLIFVPKDVLRELPVALSYSEIAEVAQYNAAVRSKVNELFASVAQGARPSKADLWDRVSNDPELVKALVRAYHEVHGKPYDFVVDPAAEYGRVLNARELAAQHPLVLTKPTTGWTPEDALSAVVKICNHFKRLVEYNGLWDAFWIRNGALRSLSERAMQRIFFGIALTYCRDGNPDLDISPETNAGPGPVDFKFSHGAGAKVTVEMKKSNHGRLLHGYEKQLKRYNSAENTSASVFLIVRVGDDQTKIDAVLKAREDALNRNEQAPEVVIVDARPQQSASKG